MRRLSRRSVGGGAQLARPVLCPLQRARLDCSAYDCPSTTRGRTGSLGSPHPGTPARVMSVSHTGMSGHC